MQSRTGPPLCRFINECRSFKNGQCPFRHDKCKDGAQCQRGDQCKFYHPQRAIKNNNKPDESRTSPFPRQNAKSQTDRKNIPCRNGPNCEKYKQGQCGFNHDMDQKSQSVSKGPIDMQCKYGPDCKFLKQGNCRFKHSKGKVTTIENTRNTQKFIDPQRQTTAIQSTTDYSSQFREFEQSKVCHDFMLDQCLNSNCGLLHQLTIDNTLKRLYSKCFDQNVGVLNRTLCTILRIGGNRVFAISKGNSVGFYELDEEFKVMKSVSAFYLKLDSDIIYMVSSMNYQTKEEYLIMTTIGKKIYVYNPTLGSISNTNIASFDPSCSAVCFGSQNIVAVGSSTGLYAIKNGQEDINISNKIAQICPTVRGSKINVVRTFLILGEYFMAVGTNDGDIVLINTNLQGKSLKIPNSSIKDIQASTISLKPFALVLVETTAADRINLRNQILVINLLDFSIEPNLSWSGASAKLTKMVTVYDKLFVCFDGTGVIIFNLPDLRKITGRIQSQCRVSHMEGDHDGNLLIVEEFSPQQNCISVYKVKK